MWPRCTVHNVYISFWLSEKNKSAQVQINSSVIPLKIGTCTVILKMFMLYYEFIVRDGIRLKWLFF